MTITKTETAVAEITLVERHLDDAVLKLTMVEVVPLPRPDDVFGHRGFDIKVRVEITDQEGNRFFRSHRRFWNPAEGGNPYPHRGRLQIAAESIATALAAMWKAGAGKDYHLRNGGFLKGIVETVPLY